LRAEFHKNNAGKATDVYAVARFEKCGHVIGIMPSLRAVKEVRADVAAAVHALHQNFASVVRAYTEAVARQARAEALQAGLQMAANYFSQSADGG
jgi:hypothetical protein